jgi:hypothetical protein
MCFKKVFLFSGQESQDYGSYSLVDTPESEAHHEEGNNQTGSIIDYSKLFGYC